MTLPTLSDVELQYQISSPAYEHADRHRLTTMPSFLYFVRRHTFILRPSTPPATNSTVLRAVTAKLRPDFPYVFYVLLGVLT